MTTVAGVSRLDRLASNQLKRSEAVRAVIARLVGAGTVRTSEQRLIASVIRQAVCDMFIVGTIDKTNWKVDQKQAIEYFDSDQFRYDTEMLGIDADWAKRQIHAFYRLADKYNRAGRRPKRCGTLSQAGAERVAC